MDGGTPIITKKTTLGLINVMMDGDFQFDEEIPLGVGMIASTVRRNGFRVTIHQCLASRDEKEIERAGQLEANVYGFQLNIVNFQNVRAVSDQIKARDPNAVIVPGCSKAQKRIKALSVPEMSASEMSLSNRRRRSAGCPTDFRVSKLNRYTAASCPSPRGGLMCSGMRPNVPLLYNRKTMPGWVRPARPAR